MKYGPRFLDVVVVDSWYANGPFLKTVVEELGWPVIAVRKQERYEIHQEALALTRGPKPGQVVERNGRRVGLWAVPALRFSDSYTAPRAGGAGAGRLDPAKAGGPSVANTGARTELDVGGGG